MSYLHSCLDLHGQVTALRYGKVQRLDAVERDVQDILAGGSGLWDVSARSTTTLNSARRCWARRIGCGSR